MDKQRAFVLCLNDGIYKVVLNDKEKATEELEKLKKEHREKQWPLDKRDYGSICFWHLHEVDYI